jgi:glycosyltransferase involved in cell wall biosynthesis
MAVPAISVVIPTYNRADFLGESIDSVLAQDFAPYEIIVVDDGSTDSTVEVLAKYGDRIRVIRQANAGFAAAREAGIRIARAPWVAFHDSDDIMLPGRLLAQMEFVDAHPDVAVVTGNAVIQGYEHRDYLEACGVDFGKRSWVIYERPFEMMLEHDFIVDPASLIRRDRFLEIGGYDKSLPSSADWDLWLRMARRWSVACLRRPYVWVRRHGGNISSTPAETIGNIRIIHKALGWGEPIAPAVRKKVLQRLYRLLKAYRVSEAEGKVSAHSRIDVGQFVARLPWCRRMTLRTLAAMPRGMIALLRRFRHLFRKTEEPQR